jgi:hypothetical protein
MLDIPDPVIPDFATTAGAASRSFVEARRPVASPLRPWGMWGGWSALGMVCAAGVAHAVSVVGRTVIRADQRS